VTTVGGARLRVVYIPFSEFGPGRIGEERELHLRDLGGSLYQTITGISPSYTTGLISHSQVFKAGLFEADFVEGDFHRLAGDPDDSPERHIQLLRHFDCPRDRERAEEQLPGGISSPTGSTRPFTAHEICGVAAAALANKRAASDHRTSRFFA
jgi:hypothetical protein